MKILPASLFANAVFVLSLALLMAVGAWYLEADGRKQSDAALHFTQADLLTVDTPDRTPPPATVDSKTLSGAWQPVALPYALPFPLSDAKADLLLLLVTLRFRLEPRLEGSSIALRWEVQELPVLPWLDPSSALHILHHTRASEIRVATACVGEGVAVSIGDNGEGFDVKRALGTTAGRGLHNQQRRARAIGGTVDWRSGPAGTHFTLWLPLAR